MPNFCFTLPSKSIANSPFFFFLSKLILVFLSFIYTSQDFEKKNNNKWNHFFFKYISELERARFSPPK